MCASSLPGDFNITAGIAPALDCRLDLIDTPEGHNSGSQNGELGPYCVLTAGFCLPRTAPDRTEEIGLDNGVTVLRQLGLITTA